MVFYCASKGAKVTGIDYADASIKLANLARSKQSKVIQKNTNFFKMDAKSLKFTKSYFDLIFMIGVVEHLYPGELEIVFRQIRKVLKKEGKLIINTAPNKIFNDVIYKFYCYPISSLITFFWNKLLNRNYPNIAKPSEIRTESHYIMHINEPTYISLFKLYKKFHFKGNIVSTNTTVIKQKITMKDVFFNFIVFLHPFSKRFPLNILFGSDFTSILTKLK